MFRIKEQVVLRNLKLLKSVVSLFAGSLKVAAKIQFEKINGRLVNKPKDVNLLVPVSYQ